MVAESHIPFSPLNYLSLSPPNIYKVVVTYDFMKLMKVKSREYKGKTYHKYRINIPEKLLQKLNWKTGQELKADVKGGKLVVGKSFK